MLVGVRRTRFPEDAVVVILLGKAPGGMNVLRLSPALGTCLGLRPKGPLKATRLFKSAVTTLLHDHSSLPKGGFRSPVDPWDDPGGLALTRWLPCRRCGASTVNGSPADGTTLLPIGTDDAADRDHYHPWQEVSRE